MGGWASLAYEDDPRRGWAALTDYANGLMPPVQTLDDATPKGWQALAQGLRSTREALSPSNVFSPADVASFAPGGGIVNAWQDSGKGWASLKQGDYSGAAANYGNMALNLAGEMPFAKLAMAMVPGVKQGIRAFHGSPHDFDRFDMSKIGTGEGAQAYGHGLYFAENEGVASGYKQALERRNVAASWDGRPVDSWPKLVDSLQGEDWRMAKVVDEMGRVGGDPAGFFRSQRDWYRGQPEMLKAVDDVEKRMAASHTPGRMYEVNINANPEHFLDWDKPLSEQSQFVQDALRKGPGEPSWRGEKDYFERFPTDPSRFEGFRGSELYTHVAGDAHGQDMAAGAFKNAGIPGIKYLDAGSRAAGDGSRNYVVFDDKLVEILKKYGWVPGAAIPAAAMLEYAGQPAEPKT